MGCMNHLMSAAMASDPGLKQQAADQGILALQQHQQQQQEAQQLLPDPWLIWTPFHATSRPLTRRSTPFSLMARS